MPKRAVPDALLLALLPALTSGQVPLGPEFQINAYTAGTQGGPSVCAVGGGDFVVVWLSFGQDGHRSGIFAQRYDLLGGPIAGYDFLINTYTTGGQHSPSVAADPAGRFTVVWSSRDHPDGSDYSGGGVFARHYDTSGSPPAEFLVNTYTTGWQGDQAVAAGGNGNFVVVWHTNGQYGYASNRVLARVYDSFGVPLSGEFPIGSGTGTQMQPAVTADASGNFIVVWVALAPDGFEIFGQWIGAFGGQGPEFQVNSYTTGWHSRPVVASDPDGNFVVVWTDPYQDGSGGGVFGQRFLAFGALPEKNGAEFQVNAYTTGDQSAPTVAWDTDGSFVVAWTSVQDGDGSGVFARRFDANGAPGPEFRVNSFVPGNQYDPSIAFNESTRFIVAWQSQSQDGSGPGVFGQRFSTDPSLDVIFKDCFSFFPCP